MIYELVDERKEETKEVNMETGTHVQKEFNEPIVGKIHDAPEYLRDNEYIHHGYRINFNSYWNIFKSLFVLHNEFVNVWTHIIGAIIVIILIFYTSIYLQSHKNEIIEAFDTKWEKFHDDWVHHSTYFQNLTAAFEDSSEFFNDYASRIKNKTMQYYSSFDEKLNQWEEYLTEKVNCIECIKSLMNKFSEMKEHFKENFQEMKEKFKHMLENNFNPNGTRFDFNFTKYFEEMNEKFHSFKEELMEKMDSKEMEWVDIYTAEEKHGDKIKLRKWPLFVFLISAIICLSFSAVFHLFFVHSPKTSAFLGRLDYAGISTLIAGSCYSPYYYLFYCSLNLFIFYITFISVFAIFVLLFSFREDFGHPSKRAFRGFLFLTLGVSTSIPILHLLLFGYTVNGLIAYPTIINWILGGMAYFCGCLIYISRLPEKKWPGKFCIWGSSHQIWHLMVFLGITFHFFGCLDSYYDRLNNLRC